MRKMNYKIIHFSLVCINDLSRVYEDLSEHMMLYMTFLMVKVETHTLRAHHLSEGKGKNTDTFNVRS